MSKMKHSCLQLGLFAWFAGSLLLAGSALAAPLYPYWINPGTPGDPNASPLPPAGPSAGLTVTLTKQQSVLDNPAASAAFDLAAQYAASWIADPIEMKITVGLGNVGGSLGLSVPIEVNNLSYSQIHSLIQSDQANHVGAGDITDFLPNVANASDLNVVLPTGFTVNNTMRLAKANAKALGIDPAYLPGSDGTITIDNAGFSWDYDPTDGISAGMFDFFGVALHEIGHIMGFFSGVDTVDTLMHNSQTGAVALTTLDLFRLTPDAGCTNFSGAARILSPGQAASTYLGECTDGLMSTGKYFGDGNSASHWKDNLGIGMMDPTFAPGEGAIPDMSDLRAFDLIGWDAVAPSSVVPVPPALWLFGSGLLGLIGISRRRRTNSAGI